MHGIDQTVSQQGAMAYVAENGKPWHELGNPVKKGASVHEIKRAAFMDWRVNTSFVRFYDANKNLVEDKQHQVMFRSDTGAVLDVTGPGYVPHQNEEVLEFFAEYVAAGEMYIDTAGVLQGGKYIWVQAALNEGFTLGKDDRVNGRVLLMNPHQYGKGMVGKVVMERVVCWNTLQMALGEGGKSIKIWHVKEFNRARQDEAKQNLGIARERLDAFKSDAQTLVKLKLDRVDFIRLLAPVFGGDAKKTYDQQGRTVQRLVELYEGAGLGSKLATAAGTGWGALNAVTQYYDHEYGRTVDSRISNAWLGQGDIKKREVLGILLEAATKGS